MCFSQRFIFALMPLCSALYWCFCHVVKIYRAISLAGNGLIQVSGRADLLPNIAGERKKRRKSGGLIKLCFYSDYSDNQQQTLLNVFQLCRKKNTNSTVLVTSARVVFFFLHRPGWFPDASAHDRMWKHSGRWWYVDAACLRCFYSLYVNPFFQLHSGTQQLF